MRSIQTLSISLSSIFRRNITNYALIIAGGRGGRRVFDHFIDAVPEETELKNVTNICNTIINSRQFDPENVKLIFGDVLKKNEAGEDIIATCNDPRIWVRAFYKYFSREIFLINNTPSTKDVIKAMHGNFLISKSPTKFFYVTRSGKLKEKPNQVTTKLQQFVDEIGTVDETLPLSTICSLDPEKHQHFIAWLEAEDRIAQRPAQLAKHFPPIYGPNTLDNIKSAFIEIVNKSKKDDNIFIFLDGHGIKSRGLVLWNDSRWQKLYSLPSRHTLGLSQLNELLSLNNDKSNIIIIINSCFSGVYNRLTGKNVAVLTSTRINKASYYEPGVACKELNELLQYWGNPVITNLLLQHAKGSLKSENFYPSDNLTHHIDNKFHYYFSPRFNKIKNLYYEFITSKYYRNPLYGIRLNKLREWCIIGFIAVDPTGIIHTIYSAKFLAFLAKFGLTGFKIFLYFCFNKLYTKAQTYFKEFEIYKIHPILYDKQLIFFMRERIIQGLKEKPNLINETSLFLLKNRNQLLEILLLSKQIVAENLTTPVHSSYHYLLEKIVLYILDAIICQSPVTEMEKFFITANLVMTPNTKLGHANHLSVFMEMIPNALRSAILLKNKSGADKSFTICFDTLIEIYSNQHADDALFKFLVVFLLEADSSYCVSNSSSTSLAGNISGLFSKPLPKPVTKEGGAPAETTQAKLP